MEDPTADVTSVRLPARQPKGLSERDLRRLLRAAKTGNCPRDYASLNTVMIYTEPGLDQLAERMGRLDSAL